MGAYLGLGSNLGDRWAYLRAAVVGLGEVDPDLVVSSVYETRPLGGPGGQGDYLNAVVRLPGAVEAWALLVVCRRLEQEAGRRRVERFGPRTLDVDVLLVDGFESSDPELTVPHPRLTERAFVLAPLEELDQAAVPARWRERLLADEETVRRVGALLGPYAPASGR